MSEQSDFVYDVFLSYSETERAWVEHEVLPVLRAAGLYVATEHVFEVGAPRVDEFERLVTESRRTLVVLSEAYLVSEWATFVNQIVQTLDPAARYRRLIPLMKERCVPPLRIRHLTYVNFADPEQRQHAWTQLLTALGAAPLHQSPETPTPAVWLLAHPYAMPPNFTGRVAERARLSAWLNEDDTHPLFVLRALGGFGKSALTWYWLLHNVNAAHWPRVIWWSFYESDAAFESFLPRVLEYLGTPNLCNLGPRQQADVLLRYLQQPGTLLILDGFERALRAYAGMGAAYQGDEEEQVGEPSYRDTVHPTAEHLLHALVTLPHLRGKVLLTTRLRPRALEAHGGDLLQGCHEEELTALHPDDALTFFRAQGIRGSRIELQRAGEPYGYHPLSLRLLAGLVVRDFQQPGDIRAASLLNVTGDLVQRRHHVLEHSYESLPPTRRRLLSHIACFRSPVKYEALRVIATTADDAVGDVDVSLHDLIARGLLHHDRHTNRFDLHPIVRRYAYDRLGVVERRTAHTHLHDYFAAMPEPPQHVERLEELQAIIELYHHTTRAGLHYEALSLYRDRLQKTLYYQFGAYQLNLDLLEPLTLVMERVPQARAVGVRAWLMSSLALNYSSLGYPHQAAKFFYDEIPIRTAIGDKLRLAISLGSLANEVLTPMGQFRESEKNLESMVELCQEVNSYIWESFGLQKLGRILSYRGKWDDAQEVFQRAVSLLDQAKADEWYKGGIWAYWAQCLLLRARTRKDQQHFVADAADALPDCVTAAGVAVEMAKQRAAQGLHSVSDFARAYWLLGAAQRVDENLVEAERNLTEALTRCRCINLVEYEADILLELARLQAAQGQEAPAFRLAEEARVITERSGYVLQGADVHLFLAEQALAASEREEAQRLAARARELARCDGGPDYTYKVTWEAAGQLLERLKG